MRRNRPSYCDFAQLRCFIVLGTSMSLCALSFDDRLPLIIADRGGCSCYCCCGGCCCGCWVSGCWWLCLVDGFVSCLLLALSLLVGSCLLVIDGCRCRCCSHGVGPNWTGCSRHCSANKLGRPGPDLHPVDLRVTVEQLILSSLVLVLDPEIYESMSAN